MKGNVSSIFPPWAVHVSPCSLAFVPKFVIVVISFSWIVNILCHNLIPNPEVPYVSSNAEILNVQVRLINFYYYIT